jgi:hypothetical protein
MYFHTLYNTIPWKLSRMYSHYVHKNVHVYTIPWCRILRRYTVVQILPLQLAMLAAVGCVDTGSPNSKPWSPLWNWLATQPIPQPVSLMPNLPPTYPPVLVSNVTTQLIKGSILSCIIVHASAPYLAWLPADPPVFVVTCGVWQYGRQSHQGLGISCSKTVTDLNVQLQRVVQITLQWVVCARRFM